MNVKNNDPQVAELVASYESMMRNGAVLQGGAFCEAYAATQGMRSASSYLAAAEQDLAAAKEKAEAAAVWAEWLPEDAGKALRSVELRAAELAYAQQWLARAIVDVTTAIKAWSVVTPKEASASARRLLGY